MQEKEVIEVIEILKEYLKDKRKTNLNRKASVDYTSFQTLISCILSLRSRDEITEKVSEKLFNKAKTPKEILALTDKELEKLVYSSGYYKNKAKVIKKISEQILKEHQGQVPDTEEKLLSLYGVGRKTANIVLSLSHNKEVIAVDTHVHRIPNRLGWISTKTPGQTEIALMKILPRKYWKEINGILVLFGRIMCLPISPKCSICPINKNCKKINVLKYR